MFKLSHMASALTNSSDCGQIFKHGLVSNLPQTSHVTVVATLLKCILTLERLSHNTSLPYVKVVCHVQSVSLVSTCFYTSPVFDSLQMPVVMERGKRDNLREIVNE